MATNSNGKAQAVIGIDEVIWLKNELTKKNRRIKQLENENRQLKERVERGQRDTKFPRARSLDALQQWFSKIVRDLQPKKKTGRIPPDRQIAILLVDGDDFGSVNKEFDLTVGDQLIRETIEVILRHIKSSDLLFRWGGDEFIIILSGQQTTKSLGKAVKRLNQLIVEFRYHRQTIRRTISVSGRIYTINRYTRPSRLSQIESELSRDNNDLKFALSVPYSFRQKAPSKP